MKRVPVQKYPSVDTLQRDAASRISRALRPSSRGQTVSIALSGGSTPRGVHELLAREPDIDWSRVHVFWGDERTVAPDDPESNFRMATESLLSRVEIPDENVHRMRGDIDPNTAAEEYEATLRRVFDVRSPALPRFDMIVLGVGADGHTASLFPGTRALEERDRLVVANDVPQLDTTRLTLTYPVLNAARNVIFLATGADKAEAVYNSVMNGDDAPPAGKVRPGNGEVIWLVDEEAGALLNSVS